MTDDEKQHILDVVRAYVLAERAYVAYVYSADMNYSSEVYIQLANELENTSMNVLVAGASLVKEE